MTFLDFFEGVEYESALVPNCRFLNGGRGSVNRQLGKSRNRPNIDIYVLFYRHFQGWLNYDNSNEK